METLTSLIVIGVVVAGNVIGWVYSYGKLSQRVEDINGTYVSMAKSLKELDGKVNGISRHVANLEGTLTTFMELMKENRGKG